MLSGNCVALYEACAYELLSAQDMVIKATHRRQLFSYIRLFCISQWARGAFHESLLESMTIHQTPSLLTHSSPITDPTASHFCALRIDCFAKETKSQTQKERKKNACTIHSRRQATLAACDSKQPLNPGCGAAPRRRWDGLHIRYCLTDKRGFYL